MFGQYLAVYNIAQFYVSIIDIIGLFYVYFIKSFHGIHNAFTKLPINNMGFKKYIYMRNSIFKISGISIFLG